MPKKNHLLLMQCAIALSLGLLLLTQSWASNKMTAETHLSESQSALSHFEQTISLSQKRNFSSLSWADRHTLSPKERDLYETYHHLLHEVSFWTLTSRLKKDIILLQDSGLQNNPQVLEEAESIATIGIQTFHDMNEKFGMIRPAGLHNMMVNTKLKDGGFCWHWTREFFKRLNKLTLHHYYLQWVTAHEGKLREHNSIDIVPLGKEFTDGLILDGWRHSGKPYWTRIKGDKYPWKLGSYGGNEADLQ